MKKLVIVGSGGFAREVLWLVEEINKATASNGTPYQVLGFVSKDTATHIQGLPVLGDDEWAFANLEKGVRFVLAIGNPTLRAQLAQTYQAHGLHALRLVHPRATLSDEVQIAEGAIICAGAVLTVNIQIGAFCIVNLNATVGHDCRIGDFVTVNPGVHLSGGVEVGDRSMLGTGAVVLPGVKLGPESVVGAGAVVTADHPGGATVVGVPARER